MLFDDEPGSKIPRAHLEPPSLGHTSGVGLWHFADDAPAWGCRQLLRSQFALVRYLEVKSSLQAFTRVIEGTRMESLVNPNLFCFSPALYRDLPHTPTPIRSEFLDKSTHSH